MTVWLLILPSQSVSNTLCLNKLYLYCTTTHSFYAMKSFTLPSNMYVTAIRCFVSMLMVIVFTHRSNTYITVIRCFVSIRMVIVFILPSNTYGMLPLYGVLYIYGWWSGSLFTLTCMLPLYVVLYLSGWWLFSLFLLTRMLPLYGVLYQYDGDCFHSSL